MQEAMEIASRKDEQLQLTEGAYVPAPPFSTYQTFQNHPLNIGSSSATSRPIMGPSNIKSTPNIPSIGRGRPNYRMRRLITGERQACVLLAMKSTWNHVFSHAKVMSLIVVDVVISRNYDQPPNYDKKVDTGQEKGNNIGENRSSTSRTKLISRG